MFVSLIIGALIVNIKEDGSDQEAYLYVLGMVVLLIFFNLDHNA
jgi:hypothetical protein